MDDQQDEIVKELLKERLKGQKIANADSKNEWWKSILKFISGGILVILTGFVNTYSEKSTLETKIEALEKDVSLLKAENDSVKNLNKNLKTELKKIVKSEIIKK